MVKNPQTLIVWTRGPHQATVEETNRTCEGLSIHSHDAKAYTGPSAKTANEMMKDEGEKNNQTCGDKSKKGANKMEINAPISPIKNITDEKVSTENGLTKKDVNGGSANNERIDTSFDDTHQVAEEGNLQNQPKDLKNVSVQAKTIKRTEKEVCQKWKKVSVWGEKQN